MEPLEYKSVSKNGKRFPAWLNELGNRSGAYVIRHRYTKEILYVGESHTGNITKTIKRHFWTWDDIPERRHFTYNPDAVEVAVRITPQKSARTAQDNLIRRLLPRDNTAAVPADVLSDREAPPVIDLVSF